MDDKLGCSGKRLNRWKTMLFWLLGGDWGGPGQVAVAVFLRGVVKKTQELCEKQLKIKTTLGHLQWDQEELISETKLETKNLVRLSL